ncbi:MAG: hypothetical protein ABI321_19310 [Polyangia bacterium]
MSLNTHELKLRVEARMDELKAKMKTFAADATAGANDQKTQTKSKLDEVQLHIKDGWDKVTDATAAKLNEWLK